jgi:hypothetical protein
MPVPKSFVGVSGVVTMNGKPLDFARVTFVPKEGSNVQGFGGTGSTDSTGKYEVRSLAGEEMVVGVPPGSYKVTINRMVKPDGTVMNPDAMEPPMNSGARSSIPMKYTGTESTPFSATVSSSGGTYDFELKSE